jgi:hypothetical protein
LRSPKLRWLRTQLPLRLAARSRCPDLIFTSRARSAALTSTPIQPPFKNVPVDGFWSISLYNADGNFQKNAYDAYSLNNITAKKSADGSVAVQFGGCDGKIPNCLPTMPGWNYMVRFDRPRPEILNGTWKFPQPEPVT